MHPRVGSPKMHVHGSKSIQQWFLEVGHVTESILDHSTLLTPTDTGSQRPLCKNKPSTLTLNPKPSAQASRLTLLS